MEPFEQTPSLFNIRELTQEERTTLYEVVHADLMLEEQVLRNASQLQVLLHNPHFFNSSHIVKAWLDATNLATGVANANPTQRTIQHLPASNNGNKAQDQLALLNMGSSTSTHSSSFKHKEAQISLRDEHNYHGTSGMYTGNSHKCEAQRGNHAQDESLDSEHDKERTDDTSTTAGELKLLQESGTALQNMHMRRRELALPGLYQEINRECIESQPVERAYALGALYSSDSDQSSRVSNSNSPDNQCRNTQKGNHTSLLDDNREPAKVSVGIEGSGEVSYARQQSNESDNGTARKLLPHPYHIERKLVEEVVIEMDATDTQKHQGFIVRSFESSLDSPDSDIYAGGENTSPQRTVDSNSKTENSYDDSNTLSRLSAWDFRGSTQSLPLLSSVETQQKNDERRAFASATGKPVRKQSKYKLVHKQRQDQVIVVSISRPSKGDYEISGEIYVRMKYEDETLSVTIVEARNLTAVDKRGYSNPYVKIYLLPDRKSSKRKTSVDNRTLNPLYYQTFKYSVPKETLGTRALWLTVWSKNRWYRQGLFIGETCVTLASIDFTTTYKQWLPLTDYSDTTPDIQASLDSAASLIATSEWPSPTPSVNI